MASQKLPKNVGKLAQRLRNLRLWRRKRKAKHKQTTGIRKRLTTSERKLVLAKTKGRCHICGGELPDKWHADHVLPHSVGGTHKVDNFLPAHALCNNYRWDYSAEEFQYILKIGVWARKEIEDGTPLGHDMGTKFLGRERVREKRRKRPLSS